MVVNPSFNKSLNIGLIRRDVLEIGSIDKTVVPLSNPGHKMWSSRRVHSNIGLAKAFDEIVDLAELMFAALVQCIKQYSNFNRLCALFEQVDDRLLMRPVLVDVDFLINILEIRAVFFWRPRDLLQKTGCNFVRGLLLHLFQVKKNVNWQNVLGCFQVVNGCGPAS